MAGIEHMGLGLAAKRLVPGVHLAVLMVATEVIDIIWILFSLTGIESFSSAPWSHSLLMSLIWSVLAGVLTRSIYKENRAGIAVGMLVFSHYIVDFITHPMPFIMPGDTGLPLYPGSQTMIGLGLYSTLPGIVLFWFLLVVPGTVLYVHYRKKGASSSKAVP